MQNPLLALLCAVCAGALFTTAVMAAEPAAIQGVAMPGVAMHGSPKYGPGFAHLDYVNPDAPKGGDLKLAASGTFDSLNPYVLKGVPAPGMGLVYQTLLTNTDDEAFSEYGLIAETVEMPDDRSWVIFNLRKEAKWQDGKPVTADDVVWTFQTLMDKGNPFYKAYYANVKDVAAEGPLRVKFTFDMAGNRELPLIMGQMPVLPKHFWEKKEFSATLDMPLGSGPYKVKSVETGKRVIYERVGDWWAKDLPITRGQYNFDTISYDMYRDENVLLQAFFAGEYDFRSENVAKSWATEYDAKPVKEGLIVKAEVPHDIPTGMQAFVFNTRRPVFEDAKVREALQFAFDFEWSNKQFAYGAYRRTESYFSNSELASSGLPQGRELEILKDLKSKFPDDVPDAVFNLEYHPPKTSGSGQDMRRYILMARQLLSDAGWKPGKNGVLEKNGVPLKFEILEDSEMFERWINPFIGNLKKLGIEATLRVVDTAQYQNRVDNFDFDMITSGFGQSMSPGNEQRDFWGSAKADVKGSRNVIGVRSKAIDALIDMVISAPDREELIVRTRALDRVLLWNYYVIPQWHIDYHRLAYWDKFGRPDVAPKYGLGVSDTWWHDAQKAGKIADKVKPDAKKR